MNDTSDKQASKCPFHRLFRPKSSREGIGPLMYVWWNSFYAVMEFFNRALARNPYRKISWDKWPPVLGLLYLIAKLRFNRSNALTNPYDYATNDTRNFAGQPDLGKDYYTADGTWVSDNENPQMGAANTRFASGIPPKKVRPDVEQMTPTAREVGKLRWRGIDPSTGKEITVPALIMSDLGGWWIQLNAHNFSGNTKRDPVSQCPHMMARTAQDNWPEDVALIDRTTKDPTRVTDNGRPTVINERTAAWIQAQIYGSNDAEEAAIRSNIDGKMLMTPQGLLPEDPKKPGIDKTGFNNNFGPGLSFLHWLFESEHNLICDYYKSFHPDWDDEKLFQMAKKANCAQMARIHTVEWTVDLLQHPTLQLGMYADWYGFLGQRLKLYLMRLSHRHPLVHKLLTPLRHNDLIWGMAGSKWEHHDGPFQVPTQFRMVYRLHEMILSEHEILEPGTDRVLDRIKLLDFVMHNTRDVVEKYGYEVLGYSFVRKSAGALTLHNVPRALTQFHNQQDGTLTDLTERDIFRERTDGTGTYNEFRHSVGEPPVTSFMELTGGNAEFARELEIKYEGDINKVDAGIGILAEPKPAGFALGFCQFYQFVLNAPRRVKSNRHLTEGFTYDGYEEGMNWVEHGGGILGVISRNLPGLKRYTEGVIRGFSPWLDIETFPLRMLDKTHADTGSVFKSDLRMVVVGALASAAAVWAGVMAPWAPLLAVLGLVVGTVALVVIRMLAMRFMQQCWKKCYTDKRTTMFGTLYTAERWINRAALYGRLGSLAVMVGFALHAHAAWSHHPLVAILCGLAALSGITTWTRSNTFAMDAQVLKVSLRNRMRDGQPVSEVSTGPTSGTSRYRLANVNAQGKVDMAAFDAMYRSYAPGRDYLTAYDFARMHEGNRIQAAREGHGNCFSRMLASRSAARLTNEILALFADRVVEENRQLVLAVSKEMLLAVCQGKAEVDLAREKKGYITMPADVQDLLSKAIPTQGLGWEEKFEGGSASAEEALINKWMQNVQQVQRNNQATAHAAGPQRAFHAQSRLAIANAEFRVSANIPQHLRVGFLQPGNHFPTLVRLSNASGVPKPDTEKDLRGAALQLDLGNDATQDFLMTNAAASHVRNAGQFIKFALGMSAGKLLMLPKLIFSLGLFETIRILRTVVRQSSRPVESLASEAFWSRAAYAFGACALKYAIFPAQSQTVSVEKGPDYLRQDLIERLKLGPIVYDFKVQLFVNEKVTPIEDGTIEWKEVDSPFVTIGQLYIPQQDLTSPQALEDEKAVNAMAFNPWNTISEIRPLGSLGRARKLVYKASAAFRRFTRQN